MPALIQAYATPNSRSANPQLCWFLPVVDDGLKGGQTVAGNADISLNEAAIVLVHFLHFHEYLQHQLMCGSNHWENFVIYFQHAHEMLPE